MWGFAGLLRDVGREMAFPNLVIAVCGVLYFLALAVDPGGIRTRGLGLLSPSLQALFLFGASGATPVFVFGRWWTVLSAAWLHAGILHIAFNMLWVRNLGPVVAHLYGPARTVIIYTTASVVGFTASTVAGAIPFLPGVLRGAGFTVGASASVFGLIGALVYYGRRGGSRLIGSQARSQALLMLAFGFLLPGVDNWAHVGGFAGGWLSARWLDPLQPERTDHVVVGLGCLLLSAAALVASVILGLRALP